MNQNQQPQFLVEDILAKHSNLKRNISRNEMIDYSVKNKEALVSKYGTLATWTPTESTGRSPQDTLIVKRKSNEEYIDWNSPNNLPIDEKTFYMVFKDALYALKEKEYLFVTDRVIGADSNYALPVTTVSDKALSSLFTDNMFRAIPEDITKSIFADKPFYLVALPYNKLNRAKYAGKLRKLENGETSDMVVAMDFDKRIGVVFGSAYMGSIKKMMFTVMNYYLPFEGILPLHCSANEGNDGKTALLLGLSGTGKTTLSADPNRALLGDDEHGWSEDGIANFENGCYAKMIDIEKEKEPDIFDAVLHKDYYLNHGSIIENAMMYPNGEFDFFDDRLTPNSRASYPLTYLKNIKPCSKGGHPSTILFLTADAYGVLPPISRLNRDQAKLWFIMGYTSKLAGTETGVVEPQVTFSRFFGRPFMPRNPSAYSMLLGEKMEKFNTNVYLVNTGWTGGPYGTGKRISLKYTRAMVEAALNGQLNDVEYKEDKLFHVNIPLTCPNVPTEILFPENTWRNKNEYQIMAHKLAKAFSDHYDKSYGQSKIAKEVQNQCPGKNYN